MASGNLSVQLQDHSRRGSLKVTLYEGSGISAVDQYSDVFRSLEYEPTYEDEHNVKWGFPKPTSKHESLPYALLDFDNAQVIVDSVSGTTKCPLWTGKEAPYIFDVSRVAELKVSLYLRNPVAFMGYQDFFLGVAKVNPWIDESYKYHDINVASKLGSEKNTAMPKWFDVGNGAGKILIGVEFDERNPPIVRDSQAPDYYEHMETIGKGKGPVFRVGIKTTSRFYAVHQVQATSIFTPEVNHTLVPKLNNPFIIPVVRVLQTPNMLYLSSPFARGGHLFYHLQRARVFDINRSKFYVSELLCAFDHLHDLNIIYTDIKPKNILLDTLGHIAICDFGLVMSKSTAMSETPTLEYPAPEQLRGEDITEAVDWWTLGIFLYEFLTGLPPFYDEDINEKHRKILSDPLRFSGPKLIPPIVQDLLSRLLNRNPKQRLGTNGVCEIKSHPFFHGIDWDKVVQRGYEPTFRPGDIIERFEEDRQRTGAEIWKAIKDLKKPRPKVDNESSNMNNSSSKCSPLIDDHIKSQAVPNNDKASDISKLQDHTISSPPLTQVIMAQNDEWELIWEGEPQNFYFCNRVTGAIVSANTRATELEGNSVLIPSEPPKNKIDINSLTVHNFPSQIQMQTALEVALKAGYIYAVAQLLEYSMDLNVMLFSGSATRTPLEWATEHENLELVELLLSKGADVNFTSATSTTNSALKQAVKKGNEKLVRILVQKTNRVLCTKALCLAVDQQNITIVSILLEYGVCCDFVDGDRPPSTAYDDRRLIVAFYDATEFLPPLVRAVFVGNTKLAQLLLLHGADANIGYHDIDRGDGKFERICIPCGRVIQVAMQLKRHEMVDLLLEFGADINLPQPVWIYHRCKGTPRNVYLEITSGLRTASVLREQRNKPEDTIR